jgi:hypothetical protein
MAETGGETVTEKPIFFLPEMVKAILDGRKTQTRRIVKPQPAQPMAGGVGISWTWFGDRGVFVPNGSLFGLTTAEKMGIHCPYGVPGDRLWVRERWGIHQCGCRVSLKAEAWPEGWPLKRLYYTADGDSNPGFSDRSSLFMPRWASRLTLELTDVRVERVQEISDQDALAEGMIECMDVTPRDSFSYLWDQIHVKDGYHWDSNPWVWCLSFKVVQP